MTAKDIIERYKILIDSVVTGQMPTKAELCAKLGCSMKTFDRAVIEIESSLGIKIVYDRSKNGYYIEHVKNPNVKEILDYFDKANSAFIMIDSLKERKAASRYISIDSSENLIGIDLIDPLKTAIKKNQIIVFHHFSFQTEEIRLVTLHPYLLKEYQNRWFLYGYNTVTKEFFIYGIERISNLRSYGSFNPIKGFDPKQDFENIIGIATRPFIKGETVQDILLSMSQEQGRYFKSLPWHPNHKILIDSEAEFRVKLHILPNYEFAQILYKYCDKVTVLEPQWLRDHLKEKFKESSEKYN